MTPAQTILHARQQAHLTQAELALRAGLRQPNIAAYETGTRTPSPRMLQRILAAAVPRPSVLLARRRDDILRLAAAHRARDMRVVGSVARGEDTFDSDVDLVVRFDDGADVFDQAGLVLDLEALLGRHVDVLSERALKSRDTLIREQAVPL